MTDTIVIGSGAGGLTAAVALARAGQKVLVLEQHELPGGWCHSFRLGGHQFSPGVHYVGELHEGGRLRRLYEGLGVANDMVFLELNPDGFEHIQVGERRVDLPRGRDALAERLKKEFPHEAEGIEGYLSAVERIVEEVPAAMHGSPFTAPFRAPTLARFGLFSTSHLLKHYIGDPVLRAVLAAQSGDHGLGPDDAPAVVHASVQAHYFNGGWYPKGGGAAIPRAFLKELKRHGGDIRLRASVEQILVEDGRAAGVRLADGEVIRARNVVSNADPGITFGRLLDPSQVPDRVRRRLGRTKWSVTALSLFFAVDMDLEAAGLDSGNYWYAATPDAQEPYRLAQAGALDGEFRGQFLTVTTLKDRSKGDGKVHTLESFVFVPWADFRQWAHTRYGERPEGYQALKEDLTERMLRGVDRIVPGLSRHVVFRELGTPLTNVHYVRSTEGNLYGTEKSRWQIGPWAWKIRTHLPGLVMCGASTVSHGVLGATQSGLFAAAAVLGSRADELLTATNQRVQLWPADRPQDWPDAARERLRLKGR